MRPLLESLRRGASPDLAVFQAALGDVLPLLDQLAGTEQEPLWHAEGSVAAHTSQVLQEAYRVAETAGLDSDTRLTLILAALLHDIGKPLTTRRSEDLNGQTRIISPRHADRGRSYLAYRLPELELPAGIQQGIMALVGHHHNLGRTYEAGTLAAYRRLARQVDLRLLYLLEQADLRGRISADQDSRLEDLELFRLQAEEYGLWSGEDPYSGWLALIQGDLNDGSSELTDLTLQQGILDFEAGLIQTPQEAVARSYPARAGFPELVVTCGPSGSGKSSWIAEQLPDHAVVSLDALRAELAGKRADQSLNGHVLQEAKERLRSVLRRKGKVVWDATNTRRDFRRVPLGLGFDYGALTSLVVFQPPVSAVFGRNPGRLHAVPPQVLAQQVENAEFPYLPEAHRTLLLDEDHRITGQAGFSLSAVGRL
ncbi:HD domain-containing protein [Deinococcus psychrotolerans]|uniref:HD domain-containing protein n=1 Tax=Deinococcus psychrotolerans TaxID=2489213 RepID=A0A3G8YHL7_9DEIO|nr:AAA family ATPase [Deinococcus psychrotolerans]AZI44340.1 HD domain-containing protein [Deinococcus psychrotolerans]